MFIGSVMDVIYIEYACSLKMIGIIYCAECHLLNLCAR